MHALLAASFGYAQFVASMDKRYRPNVAAVLQRPDGLVLIGQRSDYPECWQMPQGGVDGEESLEEAVRREILEETGIPADAYQIAARTGPHRYDFPNGPDRRGYHGQEQTYFLCTLNSSEVHPFDRGATCGEFLAVRWVAVKDFPVHLAPAMKRKVYREVLHRLFPALEESH